jgi:signal transduction histidine kinase
MKWLGEKYSFLFKKIQTTANSHLPADKSILIYFAIFTILTSYINAMDTNHIWFEGQLTFLYIMLGVPLAISTILILNELWPTYLRERYLGIFWIFSIFLVLPCLSSIFALISDFSVISTIILVLSLVILGILMPWHIGISMIIAGVMCALIIHARYLESFSYPIHNIKLMIVCVTLSSVSIVFTFFKSKYDKENILEMKTHFLEEMINYKNIELNKARSLKNEFLRNIQHETRAPITGITSMGQVLWESYDVLTEEQRRLAVKEIAQSSIRLETLINNIMNLSKISNSNDGNFQNINLSDLLLSRINVSKKIYGFDKDIEFITKITNNIHNICDEFYMSAVFDNLIANAIQYSNSGANIYIEFGVIDDQIRFAITDEGIGIPVSELYDIFSAFVVSSKTASLAGGRGVGLAVVKRVIDMHHGKIWAESDGKHGATFIFMLPIKK